ncbi:hypothetical protein POSPLADRAFT_1144115 [Postia placenta MAD-698-R-SB12]|uniref:Calpain catalytic domain-containing protein n=1 Tax=Postia placenta MAD-698-R-SB12 TaxID=670580 RepID=A0A1X6MZW9_9APHY|nr:hypothetical protein POSPLADRAFT_1144115 [Postia placenta MAD-698-R-SB12]OSX61790.1 hypothetical protein POSPLADRAFT_1144115 [Postia placenta MAD-698-R-SB12]
MSASVTDDICLAQATYSKAAKAELSDLDRAFRLYVKAAEDFLNIGQSTPDATLRSKCKDEAAKALDRAEKIKAAKPDLTPVATNYFSEQAQRSVLRRSSFVNNVRIPLWDEDPVSLDENRLPAFSPEQEYSGAMWRRIEGAQIHAPALHLLPEDILQHIVTDCSTCASIAVCVSHHLRCQSQIVLSNLKPNAPYGAPYDSQDGLYRLRIFLNGAWRRVTIDDQLPTYPNGSLMCLTTGPKRLLWPSLVEKACVKLVGTYDFPGSTSCADLNLLIGWIPEHVDLKSANLQRERLWARLFDGFTKGYCLFTVGTGEKVEILSPTLPSLIPIHCYAVVDVREDDGFRHITMLDSWVRTTDNLVDQAGDKAVSSELELTCVSGSFTMSWDDVCNTFDGVYLNWDPGIFHRQIQFHSIWKSSSRKTEEGPRHSSFFHLQLRVNGEQSARGGQAVWVLLARHVKETGRKSEFTSLFVSSEGASGRAPIDAAALALKGEYSNSIHHLVRTQVMPSDGILHLVAAYDGEFSEVGFTISAYANCDITWIEDPPKALYVKEIEGTFNAKTAGGNHHYPTFMDNPQYHLRIHDPTPNATSANVKAPTSLIVQGPRDVPMNASLVWSQGERVTELGHNEVAASSGPYSYGYAHCYRELTAGDYTLVVSAFEPRHLGEFQLHVESPLRFELTPIPQEGAGMFSKVIRDAWSEGTAGGGPNFKRYATNPAYEFQVESATQVKFRLQLVQTAPPAAVNVSIFHQTATGLMLVTTSGPYSDSVAGVVTPQVALQPGTYLAIPSTYHPDVQRAFKLVLYSKDAFKGVTKKRS